MGKSDSTTSLAPGFRFHPTDEELVSYYLKRKISGKNFRFDAIAEIDIYRVEPWDLPGLSKLKHRDLEWYFFSGLDKKYGNGVRTNRATGEGYWKTTGKDRPVHHRSRVVGMKKTLVYHHGRAPRGKRTNWVMHEYKLVDEALEKAGVSLEGCVLCRIFQKSGPGPKNGEQYGAPFEEEEWEKDEVVAMIPGEVSFEEPFADDDAYIEQSDLDQSIDWQLAGNVPVPVPDNRHHEDNSNHVENSRDIVVSEEKYLAGVNEDKADLQVMGDQQFFDLPVHNLNTADIVRNEHMVQPNVVSLDDSVNCLPNKPLPDDVSKNELLDEGLFLDAFDFLDPAEENPLDFGIPDMFFDDDIDIGQYLSFDAPPSLMSNATDEPSSIKENFNPGAWQSPTASNQQPGPYNDGMSASSSKQAFEVSKPTLSKSAIQYPCLSQASRLLGNLPAPPAFASELPTKDMAARLSAAVHSSTSVHVTAGMIRIRDNAATEHGSRLQWSVDKMGTVNVLLSFDLPGDANEAGLNSLSSIFSSKVAAAFSGGWLRSMLWAVVFAVSYKCGSFIYAQ